MSQVMLNISNAFDVPLFVLPVIQSQLVPSNVPEVLKLLNPIRRYPTLTEKTENEFRFFFSRRAC
jgi:hypothetical protein